MAMTGMTRGDARAEVREMRLLRAHPEMTGALAAGEISKSQALAIAECSSRATPEPMNSDSPQRHKGRQARRHCR
jgi:hypothetical protein